MTKASVGFSLALIVSVSSAFSQSASVSFDTGGVFELKGSDNTTLLSGGGNSSGDGFVLQFGYYSMASSSDLFAGTWTALTGDGGVNSAFTSSSIGDTFDNGAADGTFADTFIFNLTDNTSNVSLPSAGQIMAVRFYDAATVTAAMHYGAVSNESWIWQAPNTPPAAMAFSLADLGVQWFNGSIAFTGTAIPEPATWAVMLGGTALFMVVGRRRRRVAA